MNVDVNRICVIGLGYVGLPLAAALARRFETIGFDVDERRISELVEGYDRTGEIDGERMRTLKLALTSKPDAVPPAHFYIVAVPTPIDAAHQPDLRLVEAASRTVGGMLPAARAAGFEPIVVYESTVYPGVTEQICAPILEQTSGLMCGRDFFLGYSPERINPGDREHTIEKITKVVAGQTPEVLDRVADMYGAITSGGVFRAASIKAAEAAKAIENAQRDINVAFMNEITQIFARLDLSVWDVLAAARTKWNFLPFSPGLVGGHCIGVDPYYLSYLAEEQGIHPQVILAGRGVNDGMADWIAERLHEVRGGTGGRTLVLGLTFKEDVPDLRNSKAADLIEGLRKRGHDVSIHDPYADPKEARHEYGFELDKAALDATYDLVVLAVPHRVYLNNGADWFRARVTPGGTLADIKGALGKAADWTL